MGVAALCFVAVFALGSSLLETFEAIRLGMAVFVAAGVTEFVSGY